MELTNRIDKLLHAEDLYVRRGYTLKEVAAHFGASLRTVEVWAQKGNWSAKRKAWQSTPRTVGLTLREMLQRRMEGVCEAGEVTLEKAEEIARISKVIDKMEKEGYQFNAAVVEVMGEFARWLRQQPILDEEYTVVSNWIQAWLQRIIS